MSSDAPIDVEHHINAVARTIGTRTLEAGQARVLTISRTYDTDVDDMWDACTNPERIPRWFLPVTGELKVGGRYQFEGNAGGTVERCDQPNSFAATWEYGGNVSWIEVTLTPDGERTRFTLEHIAHIDDESEQFWTEYGPGAVGIGWDGSVLGLALHVASGRPLDPAQMLEWTLSEDGIRFSTLSSDAWCAASIAAGTDPAEARAAADKATAFYTTAPA